MHQGLVPGLLLLGVVTMANAPWAAEEDGSLDLRGGGLALRLTADGRLAGLTGPPGDRELLASGQQPAFFGLGWDGKGRAPTKVELDPETGRLLATYGDTGVTAEILVSSQPSHLRLTLADVRGVEVNDVSLVRLPLGVTGRVGGVVGVIRDGRTAVGVQALNVHTSAQAAKTPWGGWLVASAQRDCGGVRGASVALFACPAGEALQRIGEIEVAEGLPHPILDGEWNKLSPTARRPYLIASFGVDTIDRVLALAKRGGFRYVYHETPFETWGHFVLKRELFPEGDRSLRQCADKAEKAGIRLGLHTLSGFITTNDAYVTPVPDPRLARTGGCRLAQSITDAQDEIPVTDAAPFRNRQTLGAVLIGTEIATYGDVADGSPTRLVGVDRGAFGTSAAAHAKGDDIAKLADHGYRTLFPGIANGMMDEMTARLVELGNACGLRQISFDGLEGLATYEGGGDYPRNRFVEQCHRGWKHHVISDASNLLHYTWHWHTRMNWGELTQSAKMDVDSYRARNCEFFRDNLFPTAMGWWRIGTTGLDWEATRLEDVEYLLAKAAGNNATHALVTDVGILERHGLAGDILDLVAEWEGLRTSGALSDEQHQWLRQKGQDVSLRRAGEHAWDLLPVRYSPFFWWRPEQGRAGAGREQTFASTGPPTPAMPFALENPYTTQSPAFEVRCLPAYEYADPQNINLMPPRPDSLVREPGLHRDAPTVTVVEDDTIGGHMALRLAATCEGSGKPSGVTRVCYSLPGPVDLSAHRGLGLWVDGDGQGELLFVEVQDGQMVRPFYVPIDFEGERYVELPLGEVSLRRYYDYEWDAWSGFAPWWLTLKGFRYHRVQRVTLGLNAIPPGATVSCRVAGIKALRELSSTVEALTVRMGDATRRIEPGLRPFDYLTADADGRMRVRDRNYRPLRELPALGRMLVQPGPNRLAVAVECAGPAPWIRFQTQLVGAPQRVVAR